MFIVNTTIEVNFTVPPMVTAIPLADFNVKVRDPSGNTVIYTSAITVEDYIEPTEFTSGGVSYPLTPDSKGLWLVALEVTDPAKKLFFEYFLEVYENDTHIYQQVRL